LKTNKEVDNAPGDAPRVPQSVTHVPATFPLRLPKTVRLQAVELAQIEGISLNQFIAISVAEKLTRIESSSARTTLSTRPAAKTAAT